MNNDQLKNLALSLYGSESEEEVEKILKKHNLWDEESLWSPLGDEESNYSIIGNQSANAVNSLVEKIVNSMDAVLTKECLKEGIDPKTKESPQSIKDALEKYFHIPNGHLTNIGNARRNEIGRNIYLIASGKKTLPCITIMDKGEGQEPSRFSKTLLSLIQGAKKEIQFVHGKWGMGGSGSFLFCSPKHRLQFILSKKNHEILNIKDTSWGFTIVRMFPAIGNSRMPVFKYLFPNKEILKFQSESIEIEPYLNDQRKISYKAFESGTIFKLYQYNFNGMWRGGRLSSEIGRHLNNQISTALAGAALPFSITDLRDKEPGIRLFNSLNVRLDIDINKKNLFEEGFPTNGKLNAGGELVDYRIYLFKYDFSKSEDQGRATFAENNEGVLLVNYGQTQGTISDRFFRSKKVGMEILQKSILVLIDTSATSNQWQSDVFMNSRDRLRNTEHMKEIESQLADILSDHPLLKEHREKRARERTESSLKESKSFENVLEKILKQNETLSKILLSGTRLVNPFNTIDVDIKVEEFKGKQFPTFFTLKKNYLESHPRPSEFGRKIRIEFETDAQNDYFSRDLDSGEFKLLLNDEPISYSSLALYNGTGFLNLEIDKNNGYEVDKLYKFTTIISDITIIKPFENSFWIKTIPFVKTDGGKSPKPENESPDPEKPDNKKKIPDGFSIPKLHFVYRDLWEENGMDKHSGLKVTFMGEERGYEYYVNLDNEYLLQEIKSHHKSDPKSIRGKYATALALIGISMLRADEENKNQDEDDENKDSIEDKISEFTSSISLVLLPIINDLGNLGKELIEEFASEFDDEGISEVISDVNVE